MAVRALACVVVLLFSVSAAQDLFIPSQRPWNQTVPGRRLPVLSGVSSMSDTAQGELPADLQGYPDLCDDAIVADTCMILTEDDHAETIVTIEEIQQALASTEEVVGSLWEALHLPLEATCKSLCMDVIGWLRTHSHKVPEKSDVGCYENDDGSTICDLDLAPQNLHDQADVPGDLPDFHEGEPVTDNERPEGDENEDLTIHYTVEELAMRVANLFRIYPELTTSFDEGEDNDGLLRMLRGAAEPKPRRSWRSQVQQDNQRSEAYISNAIRAFQRRNTYSHLTKWFGSAAYNNPRSRAKINKVLNSIDLMLSKVDFVYPGPKCSPNTYAYVYPQAYTCSSWELQSSACTKNDRGQYVFYMCELTMNSPVGVRIETITHEGSHHAAAYTDDVCMDYSNPCSNTAYGRSNCQRLARSNPTKAMDNADNYCYYIQDVTDLR